MKLQMLIEYGPFVLALAFLMIFVLIKLYFKMRAFGNLIELAKEHPGMTMKTVLALVIIVVIYKYSLQFSTQPVLSEMFFDMVVSYWIVLTIAVVAVGVQNTLKSYSQVN